MGCTGLPLGFVETGKNTGSDKGVAERAPMNRTVKGRGCRQAPCKCLLASTKLALAVKINLLAAHHLTYTSETMAYVNN